jgi:predicted CxxxxCH...CXXCH cytochrome family protein
MSAISLKVAGDTTPPSVSAFTATTPTNSRNIPITSFTASDNIGVTGYLITESATPPAFNAAGWTGTAPSTYTVTTDNTFNLYPWAKDAANNVSAVFATPRTVFVDATPPTVTIKQAAAQADPTATSPINFTVLFSEPVTTFATGDVTISGTAGGTKTATVTGSGTTYNVAVTGMTTSGTVIASLAAGVASDAVGNASAASTSTDDTVSYDVTPPTGLTLSAPLDAAIDQALAVTLQVTAATDSNGPVQYYFQISSDNTFLTNVNTGGWQAGTSYAPPTLTNGVTYFWRVKARDGLLNETGYSTPQSFSTLAACVRNNPTVTLLTTTGSTASTITADNGSSQYNLKIVNNDYGSCAPTTFTLSATDTDTGNNFNTPTLSAPSVTLANGVTATIMATVTATAGKTSGTSLTRVQTAADANHTAVTSNDVTTTINVVTCIPQMPLLIIGPDKSYVDKGSSVAYTVSVKNTDTGTGCSAVTYNLTCVSDTNSTDFSVPSVLSASSLSLASGQTDSVTLTVSAKATGPKGAINITTIAAAAAGHTAPANVTATSKIGNPLLHNSDVLTAGKWGGSWGVPGGKYGEFVCTTCHVPGGTDTKNIKGIRESITTPNTANGTLPGDGQPIVFNRIVGTAEQGVFGNDSSGTLRATPRASSTKICEVCHTYSTSGNGVTYHPYATAAKLGNHQSSDGNDCITCHKHNRGFGPDTSSCTGCHGNPPLTGPTGGAHGTHTAVLNFTGCGTCHTGGMLTAYVANATRDISFNAFGNTAGTFDGRAGVTYSAGNTNGGTQSCSSVYCHGATMAPNGGSDITPVWITPSTGACGTCHGATAANPPIRGSHGKHASASGLALPCSDCHKGFVPASIPANMAEHVNNKSEVALDVTKIYMGSTATYSGGTTATMVGPYGSCNVYCHSTVQGASGLNFGIYTSIRWGANRTLACNACHADMSGVSATGSHIKHANAATGYGMVCSTCHTGYAASPPTVNAALHANHTIDVTLTAPTAPNGTYGGGTAQGDHTPGGGYGTCTVSYCHSDGAGNYPAVNALWGSASTGACGSCHGVTAAAPPTSAAHSRHVGSTVGKYGYSCSKCHSTVVDATPAIIPVTGVALHVNGSKNVAFDATTAGVFDSNTVTCTATYCHSQGTGATGQTGDARALLASSTVPAWTATASCSMCHTGGNTSGPTYASGSPKANSHAAHTQAGVAITCDVCHNATTTDGLTITTAANHVNKTYNVTPNPAKASFIYTYASTGGSCATDRCHGGGKTWGTSTVKPRCEKCHGYRSSGWTALNGATAATDAKVGAHFNHISSAGTKKYSAPLSCVECHASSIALTADSVTAAGHFDTAGPAELVFSTLAKTGSQVPAYNSPAAGRCATTYCHGASLSSNSVIPTSWIAAPTWGTSFLTGTAGTVGNGSTTPGTGDCSTCHGYPPMTTTHNNVQATNCVTCHTHVNPSGTGFTDASKHINGVLEAEGGGCNGCHDYDTVGATYSAGVWSGGTWGVKSRDGLTPNEGWGAHAKHINYLKERLIIATALDPTAQIFGSGVPAKICGTCHSNLAANHTMGGSTVRSINFGDGTFKFGASGGVGGTSIKLGTVNPVYNGTSGTSSAVVGKEKTCSNVSCHYFTKLIWSTY